MLEYLPQGGGGPLPDVTVVTPAHNSDPWLDETISSVRRQTFPNFRYVIVDDGSTDASLRIAEHHAAEDPRLSVISVNFGNVADARQKGVDQASSPLVAFLDGDDRWHPEFLERMRTYFHAARENVIAIYSLINLIDAHSQPTTQSNYPKRGSVLQEAVGEMNFDRFILCDIPAATVGTVVIRAAALKGKRFRASAVPNEGYDLWLRVLDDHPDGIFLGINERIVDYRLRGDSQSTDTANVFAGLDRIYARNVPRMRRPETRWEVYEAAATGARARGQPEYAEHFQKIGLALAADSNFKPYLFMRDEANAYHAIGRVSQP